MPDKISTNWRERILRYAPLFLWICMILYLSGGQASLPQTSRFIRPLLEFLFPDASPQTIYSYHEFIRKLAHLFVYSILGGLAAQAFRYSSRVVLSKNWPYAAIVLVFLVAALDELKQGFEVSRTSTVWDVVLDVASGALAIVFIKLVFRRRDPLVKNDSSPAFDDT